MALCDTHIQKEKANGRIWLTWNVALSLHMMRKKKERKTFVWLHNNFLEKVSLFRLFCSGFFLELFYFSTQRFWNQPTFLLLFNVWANKSFWLRNSQSVSVYHFSIFFFHLSGEKGGLGFSWLNVFCSFFIYSQLARLVLVAQVKATFRLPSKFEKRCRDWSVSKNIIVYLCSKAFIHLVSEQNFQLYIEPLESMDTIYLFKSTGCQAVDFLPNNWIRYLSSRRSEIEVSSNVWSHKKCEEARSKEFLLFFTVANTRLVIS